MDFKWLSKAVVGESMGLGWVGALSGEAREAEEAGEAGAPGPSQAGVGINDSNSWNPM